MITGITTKFPLSFLDNDSYILMVSSEKKKKKKIGNFILYLYYRL